MSTPTQCAKWTGHLSLIAALCGSTFACDSKPRSEGAEPTPKVTSDTTLKPSAHATSEGETPPPSATAAAKKSPRNVLLITVDSLRADMPWNGYSREIAPNLSKLAERSVVYENFYSVSSYTAKSVSSMLTSRYPSSLYRSGWFFAEFSDANLFLTEVLANRGVRTMAGHAHKYFDRGKKLEQGFDLWEVTPDIRFDSDTDKNVTSEKLNQIAMKMLSDEQNTKGQFFMWLHYMDPHDQYIQHEGTPVFGKNNRDRYDSEVYFTDSHIGKLFEFGAKQPWWDNTAILISADHGEAFGEHGMFKHAFELWEVLTRVPLIVYVPGATPRRIEERRSAIDVGPTILELMGVEEMPKSFVGKTLMPEINGAPPDNREPIILDLPEDKNNPDRHAIIQGNYKLIVYGPGMRSFQLFDLSQDPNEETDLAKKLPEKLEEMKALYTKTWEGLDVVEPYGGMELRSGRKANGVRGPEDAAAAKKP
jgi:choline-sulfatase